MTLVSFYRAVKYKRPHSGLGQYTRKIYTIHEAVSAGLKFPDTAHCQQAAHNPE